MKFCKPVHRQIGRIHCTNLLIRDKFVFLFPTYLQQKSDTDEVIYYLCKGLKGNGSYPASVRAFSMSLHYLSPRAYSYVREKFNKTLPHCQTIRQWYRNSDIDSSSGIGQNALNALQEYAEKFKEDNGQLIVSLVFDEMAIQRNLLWCRSSNKFLGLIDRGKLNEDEEFTLASNVIVFMACGLNAEFEHPIAFYLIQTLSAEDRANIVTEVIKAISERGIKVANITFDGYKSNAKMCEILGANLSAVDGEYITSFPNPYDDSKIRIIFDPSHLMKLWRNTLGNRKVLWDGEEKIEWDYFVELVDYSRQKNFGLTHKMNKRHIQFYDRKMHVRTAVETFSQSTADAIEFLQQKGHPDFEKATATIKMTRIFDSLWDVMNTQRIRKDHPNNLKSALNSFNKTEVFSFMLDAKRYISQLKIINPRNGKKELLINSECKTGFRGAIVNILSIIDMYEEFIEKHFWMDHFASYRISQDHLEMFFGKIRSLNGCNDNPNIQQFISAYRKLLLQIDFSISSVSNITSLCNSNVLAVSSRKKHSSNSVDPLSSINYTEEMQTEPFSLSTELPQEWEQMQELEETGDAYDPGIAFAAISLEHRLLKCNEVYCDQCVAVFAHDQKLNSAIPLSNKYDMPTQSTYNICEATDKAIKDNLGNGDKFKEKIYSSVMNQIDCQRIFPEGFSEECGHDINHKKFLVKFFIDEYMNNKCAYIAKQTTIALQKRYNKNRLRKLGHNTHL